MKEWETNIASEESVEGIEDLLISAGCSSVSTEYEDYRPVAMVFSLEHNKDKFFVRLPVDISGIRETLIRVSKKPDMSKITSQAEDIAWQYMYQWVLSQVNLWKLGMAEIIEAFLPFVITKKGTTVYQSLSQAGYLHYEPGPLLLED